MQIYKTWYCIIYWRLLRPKTGKVYRSFTQNKDRDEVKRFLKCIARKQILELHGKKIKLILDNLSTHKLDGNEPSEAPRVYFHTNFRHGRIPVRGTFHISTQMRIKKGHLVAKRR